MKFRNNFCNTNNPYLFALPGTNGPISGYHVFRKHVINALNDPSKTATLTSTKLRKHLATISQILRMGQEELEQLASFMGHTTKTPQEWYRLPQDLYQIAKVSKVLLMSQKSSIKTYKGEKLDELIVELEIFGSDESEDSETENLSVETTTIQESNSEAQKIPAKKKKGEKKKWSKKEKQVTETFFNNHISKHLAPKHEVLDFMKLYPTLFADRKWDSIKVYVCNQYNKKH